MLAQGTVSGLMIAAAIFATITFFLSLKFGKSGWTRGDKICLFLSALAIALWIYFGDSNIGIAFSIAALAIAVLPTYQSAWNDSKNEDALTWILFNISSALGVLAVMAMSDSQFADSAPAIAFLAIDFPLLYLVVIRPRLKKRNEHATSSTTR
jgi:hypothetical protein